ncbi:MAG: hypothetical protein E6R08_00490 [Nevskiaceae bacterium]|nr:MAG: hypothetical protein E6R08_00490 [Nevskiaceae bacterium]
MSEKPKKTPVVTLIRQAGPEHQVVTVEGGRGTYRRQPCGTCPWRVDAVGEFPAKAFEHSAETAWDMSDHTFACHESGTTKPALCAGFLLKGADHNLKVRLMWMRGELARDITDGGHALHDGYTAMAVANGVDPDHPRLKPCRS